MASLLRNIGIVTVLFGILYQSWLKDFLFITVGINRVIQPIEDFPFNCRRLQHQQLEGCEDLWLDDEARVLYAACSGSISRTKWNQGMSKFDVNGRRPGGSQLMALNVDSPGSDGLFGLHPIKPVGYTGAIGDERLDLVGFDADIIDDSTVRFYLINQRPPVNAEKKYLDASKVGANATIDIFDLKRGESKMQHVKTFYHDAVYSPNGIASLGGGAFVTSNDHSTKVGLRKEFDMLIGGGNVVHCPKDGACVRATGSLIFPNGLARGSDGLIYVPSSIQDIVRVMEIQQDGTLKEVDTIRLGMPLDNLTVDANGDIFAAGFPKLLAVLETIKDPMTTTAPSTVLKIKKTKDGYETSKIVEDRDMKFLSGVTTARHDVRTGRIFLGAAITPFMAVCDPNETHP